MVKLNDLVVMRELGFGVQLFVEDPEAVRKEAEDGAQDEAHHAACDEQRRFVVEVQNVLGEPHTAGCNQETYKVHDGKQNGLTNNVGLLAVPERPEAVCHPGENTCNNRRNGLRPHFAAVHRAGKQPDENGRVNDKSNTADGAELCYLTPKK